MEISALLVFFFCELAFAAGVYTYWLRRRSGLLAAKSELVRAVTDHCQDETVEQYIRDLADGAASVLSKRKWLKPYLKVFVSGILGFVVVLCVRFLTGAGVVLRTLLGTLAMFPFVWLLAVEIAKEADDNKILYYEKSTARRVLEKIEEGTTNEQILDILQQS